MEDKFDKTLSNKIKEVTENRDIPYNPEHWKMLMAKKKKKKSIFYWQIAAFFLVTLLAGGLGKYFINTSNLRNSNNPKIIFDNKNDSLRIDDLKTNNKIFITSRPEQIDSLNKSETKISLIDSTTISNKSKYNSKFNSKVKEAVGLTKITNKKQTVKNKIVILPVEDIANILNDSLKGNSTIAINNLRIDSESSKLITENKTNKDSIYKNSAIIIAEQKSKKDSLTIKKDIIAVLEEENFTDESNRKSLKLGIDLSPLYNYNQQSANSNIGFAGGVTVELPISNKFDISTGIFYVDQKLDLNKSSSYLSDVVSSKSSSQLTVKEAVLKGIEIPINIKYNFAIDKKNVFVSAGFTSTTYIKDNIEENYIVNNRTSTSTQDTFGNNIVKYELVQTDKKVVTPSNSNSFNFANILNLSIGFELPLIKQQQSIIVAPYLKYSLTPVTEQKIDFSSAGIHLRYNFSLKK
tara:strand:- start:1032 stop:2423 length:1392 start_codon:yes stop_codon:yes gene_type:complete